MTDELDELHQKLAKRYGTLAFQTPIANPTLRQLAGRGSCRRFTGRPVQDELIDTLCAAALASPTKSDLQQRDIVIVQEPTLREEINRLFGERSWIAGAPALLVFCGNNRRQRQVSEWRDKPFPNDHLDAFFNAGVDAAIALSTFVVAAESVGLGCCPISEIRNHCSAISTLLRLPKYVFPVAGLAVGWPARSTELSMRLPLCVTVHRDGFSEPQVRDRVEDYDRRRSEHQPYPQQRQVAHFGQAQRYGWSEDKARQYSVRQRADFGTFIRERGFSLD